MKPVVTMRSIFLSNMFEPSCPGPCIPLSLSKSFGTRRSGLPETLVKASSAEAHLEMFRIPSRPNRPSWVLPRPVWPVATCAGDSFEYEISPETDSAQTYTEGDDIVIANPSPETTYTIVVRRSGDNPIDCEDTIEITTPECGPGEKCQQPMLTELFLCIYPNNGLSKNIEVLNTVFSISRGGVFELRLRGLSSHQQR